MEHGQAPDLSRLLPLSFVQELADGGLSTYVERQRGLREAVTVVPGFKGSPTLSMSLSPKARVRKDYPIPSSTTKTPLFLSPAGFLTTIILPACIAK